MAMRPKGMSAAKRKPGSDVRSLLRELTARVTEAVESSRHFGAVVEDMRAQNRATIEAVLGLREEFQRDRVENRERFDRLENAVLKLSSDVVGLKSDVAVLKSDVAALKSDVAALKSDVALLKSDSESLKASLARVEEKLDGKADIVALRAVEARVSTLESCARSA